MEPTKQKPSLGRVVLLNVGGVMLAARVCKVWSEETINVAFDTENGEHGSRTSVTMGDGDGKWMWPPRV